MKINEFKISLKQYCFQRDLYYQMKCNIKTTLKFHQINIEIL